MSKFIHLHTHSHFSLLTALPKIPELVSAAKENNMTALALTDNGNMYGAIEFYKECKENDIKPIVGVDFYVALDSRHNKRAGIDNKRHRLVLLAKDIEGYKNLIKLTTESNLTGFYYKPRIDRELMKKYSKGLIAIIPSFSGETTDKLKLNDLKSAEKILNEYKEIYGEDLYLEITHHPEIEGHSKTQEKIVKLSGKFHVPLVAAHDVYYLKPEDKEARETLLSVQSVGNFGSNRSINNDNEDFSFINPETADKYFKNIPEAIENTNKISSKCNLELEIGNWVFPNINLPNGSNAEDELKKLVYEGIKIRGLEKTKELMERVNYELEIIRKKGYCPYFLVVGDLMNFAHKNKILTTIRGSVSGSLVTYLARITNINPLDFKIPFERFLNPDRPSPPDIDMDFADTRRDEVIQYAREKYGEDKVAQIGTFGTMMARGSVRDTARALGFSYEIGDKIAKQIPLGKQGFPMTIDRALNENPELKKMYKDDKDVKRIINMAKKIEGCARHISVHAAGVVISPKPLTDYVPVQLDPKGGKLITQYDMHCVEDAGLLKFDFLGIKNLTILNEAVRRVKKIHGIELDIEKIPIDDKKTFEMLSRGETMGLFQLNGSGMTKFLKDLKPNKIDDINAMVALYRPGPIQFIPQYIERKHNPKLIKYTDPALEPILKRTYGVLVYQDDLLMMAHDLAGYSWMEVDKFRKAVGKKIPKLMAEQKQKFINGCIETKKWTRKRAEEIWSWVEPFAAYGFNKAHSVSYGRVAYQTAYMKANYPIEYMSAVLTADSGDVEKIADAIKECQRMKIPVLPPSVNESFSDFGVIGDKIRFGLCSIKNFGDGIADTIIQIRKKDGKYKSLSDFLERVIDRNLNKKSLEALIKSGALDELGERGQMLKNMEDLLTYNKENSKLEGPQDSLFGLMKDSSSVPKLRMTDAEKATKEEKLEWEKDLLGLYISGHPLDKFKEKLEKRDYSIKKIKEDLKEGMIVAVAGMVETSRPINTKNGDIMSFISILDLTGSIEIVVFPKIFQVHKEILEPGNFVLIKGRISHRNSEVSLVAEAIKKME